MAKKSAKEMQNVISLLYRAVSKVTAEIPDHKGQQIKQAYAGTFSDLFSGIEVSNKTVTKFIWVITHKVGELSSPLFKRNENGELIRNCSGFYTYQDQPDGTKKKVHITGEALVEYLYRWMQEYKVAPRENKPVNIPVIEAPKLPEYAKLSVSPDQLTDAELDTAIQELQATLNAFVSEKNRRAEITAKKRELFKTVSELIAGEGFTLDEIMQIV